MNWKTLVLVVALLAGCSTQAGQTVKTNVDVGANRPLTLYWDEWVRKGAPQIFVSPDRPPENPPTAVFMPLRLTQQMEHANSIGYNLSRVVWQTWLQVGALPTIEFAEGAPPYRRDLALAYAKQRGADLAIGGTITYYKDGGTVGDSGVSLSLEIYDVRSGNLIWSFGQAAVMQSSKVNDFIIFSTRTRVPTDPVTTCLMASAADLAQMVRHWAYDIVPGDKSWQPKAF